MAGEHPFDRLTAGYQERMARRDRVAYEAGRVGYLMREFGLNARRTGQRLRELDRRETGTGELTLRAWNLAYPSFPIVLGADPLTGVKLHAEPTAFLPALFKNLSAAPFVEAYEKFYEATAAQAAGKPVGLVFRRKGVRHGLLIYQADDVQALPLGERETMMVYAGGGRKDRHWLVLRMFQKAVEAVHNKGHGWTADD